MINYHKERFNCAHWAISEINKAHGTNIEFEDGDAWQASFLPFLRGYFKPVSRPIEECLVVMTTHSNTLHVGIYRDFAVHHNYNFGSSGCVIISDMGSIRAEFKRVRFYAIS